MTPNNVNASAQATNLYYKTILPAITDGYRKVSVFYWILKGEVLDKKMNKYMVPEGIKRENKVTSVNFENETFNILFDNSLLRGDFTGPSGQMSGGQIDIETMAISAITYYNAPQVNSKTIKATRSNKAAVKPIIKQMIYNMKNAYGRDVNAAVLNGTALGAVQNSNASESSYTTSGSGTSKPLQVGIDAERTGIDNYYKGRLINIAGATGGTVEPGVPSVTQVLGIGQNSTGVYVLTKDNMTVSATSSITPIAKDFGTMNPPTSMSSLLVTSGAVQGISDISQYPTMTPHVISNAGSYSAIKVRLLWKACKHARPSVALTNTALFEAMGDPLTSNERTGTGKDAYLDNGFNSFTIMGGKVDVCEEYDMATATLWLLTPEMLSLPVLEEVHFLDDNIYSRISGFPVYEIPLESIFNLATSDTEPFAVYSGVTGLITQL